VIQDLSEAHDGRQFGGKATHLCRALRAGLPVPSGVALGVEIVEAVARGDSVDALDGLLDRVGAAVAVRSSAVGEDSADASFAGQHLTYLNVRSARALRDAVARIWESARSESALAYRRRLGLQHPPRMAVVVQLLVHADRAGVLFTQHPTTGADERLVEAAWGLGEAVVQGLVVPDRYRMERGGRVLERELGEKDTSIVWADEGTRSVDVDVDRVAASCLSDAELSELDELATRCEALGAGGHDLEWAFQGGELFLLQQRPITRGSP
jgi:pyruvate,water dikinase